MGLDDVFNFCHEVSTAIDSLNTRKAADTHGISDEHIRYDDSRIRMLLTIRFNAMLRHGFLIESAITPVVKK